jgi:hypothetical protein
VAITYLSVINHFCICVVNLSEFHTFARCWWLTPGILVIQEAKIGRITVQSQPRQIVHETLSQKKKKPSQKKGWWSGSRCRS